MGTNEHALLFLAFPLRVSLQRMKSHCTTGWVSNATRMRNKTVE